MSAMPATLASVNTGKELSVADIEAYLYAEARSLDDRDFETWL